MSENIELTDNTSASKSRPLAIIDHAVRYFLTYPLVSYSLLSAAVTVCLCSLLFKQFQWAQLFLVLGCGLIVGFALAITRMGHFLQDLTSTLANFSLPSTQGINSSAVISSIGMPPTQKLLALDTQALEEWLKSLRKCVLETEEYAQRFKVLTENVAAAVLIRNAQGKIVYASPFTEVLTGYPLSDLYSSETDFLLGIVHQQDQEKYLRALKVSACGEAFQFRFRFFHKSGIEMWGETRAVPILDEQGAVGTSLSVILDVTGSVRYQRQVEEKNRDLRDFSYMISHDLKGPLSTIKGMLHIIQEDFGNSLDAHLKDPLDHISRASSRLEQLIESVLEYSRISNQEIAAQEVSLDEVLSEVHKELGTSLSKAGASFTIEKDLGLARGDKLKFYQIFSNLAGNAIKYRSEERPLALRISRGPLQNSRYTEIIVEDNGLGIPAEKIDAIFRPFQRAHTQLNIEGSGIGLACVKKLIEKLGGEISFSSTEGKGTKFSLVVRKA